MFFDNVVGCHMSSKTHLKWELYFLRLASHRLVHSHSVCNRKKFSFFFSLFPSRALPPVDNVLCVIEFYFRCVDSFPFTFLASFSFRIVRNGTHALYKSKELGTLMDILPGAMCFCRTCNAFNMFEKPFPSETIYRGSIGPHCDCTHTNTNGTAAQNEHELKWNKKWLPQNLKAYRIINSRKDKNRHLQRLSDQLSRKFSLGKQSHETCYWFFFVVVFANVRFNCNSVTIFEEDDWMLGFDHALIMARFIKIEHPHWLCLSFITKLRWNSTERLLNEMVCIGSEVIYFRYKMNSNSNRIDISK